MTRKIITGVIAAILVVTIAVFAAEKAKEKAFAEKPCPKAKAGELQEQGQHEGLLDQLAEAYKANDKQKMGEIINKMQERREEMQELAKANKWHQGVHRRWAKAGPGRGHGQQMAGPGWNRGCSMQNQGWNQRCAMNGPYGNCGGAMRGQGPNQGCPMANSQWGQFQPMRGRGFAGCNNNNMMGNCGPMAGGFGQMPGCGRGFQKNCAPGQDAGDMEPRGCNMPRRERMNVPPPEWGW